MPAEAFAGALAVDATQPQLWFALAEQALQHNRVRPGQEIRIF